MPGTWPPILTEVPPASIITAAHSLPANAAWCSVQPWRLALPVAQENMCSGTPTTAAWLSSCSVMAVTPPHAAIIMSARGCIVVDADGMMTQRTTTPMTNDAWDNLPAG
eukprot:scaffold14360_cov57-Phaeocystis_antarctica.AAC.2